MIDKALYLFQVSFCVSIFYGLYIALFKNTTFFLINRIYLLGGLIFSFVIPALQLSSVAMDYHLGATDFITTSLMPTTDSNESAEATTESINFSVVLAIIYWTGFVFMISRLLLSVNSILKIKNQSVVYKKDNIKVVHTELRQPFSFFNVIFLPKQEINSWILEHEKIHVHQHHWIDLLVVEISSIVLWFNPMMILYKRSIKIQHEYLADAGTIRHGVQLNHYLDCMLTQIQFENAVAPISQFYSQTIKKRIMMMTKNKTANPYAILYALLLPILCMLLFAFSNQPVSTRQFDSALTAAKGDQVVIIVDAGHGGQDVGVLGREGTSEKEFVLAMAKRIQKIGEEKGIKVILTRTGDEALALKDRTLFASRFAADLFISIHANYDQQNASTSGIECIVSESNIQFNDSKRFADQIVNQLQTLEGIAVNGIKKSNSYVLKNNSIPAVILELGYLSNASDYAFIREDKNQKLISERIITAVTKYVK